MNMARFHSTQTAVLVVAIACLFTPRSYGGINGTVSVDSRYNIYGAGFSTPVGMDGISRRGEGPASAGGASLVGGDESVIGERGPLPNASLCPT